jgi:adenylate cyclase
LTGSETREIRRGTALIVDVVQFYRQQAHSLESTAEMLDDLYTTIANAVVAQRGTIIKWLGDGALACFWEETHALDAVRTALTLQEGFKHFAKRHGFGESGLTISIATGEMIVGPFGAGTSRHHDVFGEPVNCTATIMPEASGEITLCAATYKAVADMVEVEPLTEHAYYGPLYALRRLIK